MKKLEKFNKLVKKLLKQDVLVAVVSDFVDWFSEKLYIHFISKNENKKLKFNKWDIYFVNLWKNIWTELNKNRPCIIYSDFYFNNWNDLIVIPIKWYNKSKYNKKIHIFLSKDIFTFLYKNSLVDLKSIRQISKKRIWKKIWTLDKITLSKIDNKLQKILWLKKER